MNICTPTQSQVRQLGKWVVAGIVVTYAKPFTRCHGVGTLDPKVIPPELRKVHDVLIDLRHKFVAHLDAVNFASDDPKFGNINQVRIFKKKTGKYGYSILVPHSDLVLKQPVQDLCSKLLAKASYHLMRFEKKYISGHELPHGSYLLNIDAAESRAFLPKS